MLLFQMKGFGGDFFAVLLNSRRDLN
jgi:hypothetical protein